MAYTILRSNGSTLTTIQDGTINTTSTSIGLPGRNYPGYGATQATAFVRIIENFADDTPPPNALKGQFWFNTNTGAMNVCPYDRAPASAWSTLSSVNTSGDMTLGNITLSGNLRTSANIISTTSGGKITFSNIESNGIANLYTAQVNNTLTVAGLSNLASVRTTSITTGSTTTDGTITGQWNFLGLAGANTVTVTGKVVADDYMFANGASIPSSASTYGNTQVATYLPLFTGNIGSSGTAVNTITAGRVITNNLGNVGVGGNINGVWTLSTGSKIEATYADVAERYHADATYEVGTVLELGGINEVTKASELSENVFGVVSKNPAHLLNALAGTSKTHPPVALIGRTPVLVIGTVDKFARLVSAGNGYARQALDNEITPFNSIGRALESSDIKTVKLIEATVKVK